MDTEYQNTEYRSQSQVHLSNSLGSAIREITSGFKNVVRDDIQLVKAEVREASGQLRTDLTQLGIAGALVILGTLPFLAFLVVGLGVILGGNYWLSALIVSAVFFAAGGVLAMRGIRNLKRRDVSFPHTRLAIQHEMGVINRKIHEISDIRSDLGRRKGRAA